MNLLAGCLAVYFAFTHQFNAALLFVLLGVFFDFFDGFFARILGVESELGVQLDSMADLITSGFAPVALMYQLFYQYIFRHFYGAFFCSHGFIRV